MASLTPPQLAGIWFVLGLVFGSFGYATYLRLADGVSLLTPRSRCPACGHALGPLELVPLLGFVSLRGKCRTCRARIPLSYPLAELAMGLAGAAGGYAGDWGGGAAVLGAGVCVAVGAGLIHRGRHLSKGSPGVTLVENLVALAIIAMVVAPVVQLMVQSVHGVRTARERMLMHGLARQRLNELESKARLPSLTGGYGRLVSEVQNNGTVELNGHTVTITGWEPNGTTKIHRVTVKVTCSSEWCTWKFGDHPPEFEMTSYLWAK